MLDAQDDVAEVTVGTGSEVLINGDTVSGGSGGGGEVLTTDFNRLTAIDSSAGMNETGQEVRISDALTLSDGLTIDSTIETTTVNAAIDGASANAIDIQSADIGLGANLTTTSQDITLGGNVAVADGTNLTITTGAGTGGSIQVTGSLSGTAGATAESLTLTAGTGDVTLAEVGTAASSGLESIEITSANSASISGTVDLDSTLTVNADSVTIQGDVTTSGEIDITATNGSITIQSELDSSANSSEITLTATGDVSLSGATAGATTGGGTFTVEADSESDGSGTFLLDDVGGVVNTTGTADGSVLISAADVDLVGTVNAGNESVAFVSSEANQAIALGTAVGGEFSLTDAEIDNVSAASLQVGEADDGNVTFTNAISPANAATLALVTGGSVTETVSGTAFTGTALTIDGKLAPGTSPGTFDVSGNFAFGATAQFELEIDGVTPGTQHDQLVVAGNVDLNGAALELVFGTTLANGDEIILVSNDQSDVVTGQFVANFDVDNGALGTPRALAEGDVVLNNFGGSGSRGRITYSGGDGNDVAIVLTGVLLNVGSVTDIIFNLPDADNTGANAVTVSDGSLANDGMMLISGTNFEDTIFQTPTGSLTINGGSMNDEIIVVSFDGLFDAGLALTGGAGTDSIDVQPNFSAKGITGASVSAEQVDVADFSARGGSVNLTGASINLNGTTYSVSNIAGEDNNITFDGDVNLTNVGLTSVLSSGAVGEFVSFTGNVDGSGSFFVNGAGNAAVTFDGEVGGATPLGSLTLTGGSVFSLNGGSISTTGTQQFSNTLILIGADTMFDADDSDITFSGELRGTSAGGADDVTIDVGTGKLEFNDAVGASSNIGAVSLVAGDLVQDGTINAQGQLTITASDSVQLNRDITSGGSTAIVVTSDDVGGTPFLIAPSVTLSSTSGMLSIQADDMSIAGTIDATGQTVLLRQNSDSEAIELGGSGGTIDELELSDGEIDAISAEVLRIGHAASGNIRVTTQAVSPDNVATLSVVSGATITDDGGSLGATNLAIQAVGNVTLDNSGAVNALAASVTGPGSSFIFTNENDGLVIGSSIDGLTGITTAANTSGNSGSITLSTTSGSIEVAEAITTGSASGAAAVTSGSISLTAGSGAIFGSATPQTGSATSNDGGAGSASSGGIALVASEISDDGSAAASGAFVVSIGSASGGNVNTDGALSATVTGSGDAGEIIVASANNLAVAALDTAGSDTTTVNVAVTTAGNTLTISNAVDADQDDVTLTADDVTIANGIQGTGTLLLQPLSTTRSIGLGGGAGDFNLDDADLGQLTDGFSSITIGRADGEHAISVDSATFTDPITIQAPNGAGSINVADSGASTSGLVGNGDASITIDGPGATTTLAADIVTSGNEVLISDNVVLTESVAIDTTNGGLVTVGNDVRIVGTIEDTNAESNSLTVNGGSAGNVDLQSDIGTVESVAGLTIANAANLDLRNVTLEGGSSATQIAGTGTTTVNGGITTSGAGSVSLTTSGNIVLVSGSSLTTVDGGISLNANTAASGAGDFVGIDADNVTIQTTGTGDVSLTGSGGDDVGTGSHIGVFLHNGTSVSSTLAGATAGTIGIVGFGGDGTSDNSGVDITDATTVVQAVGGDISIVGSGSNGSGTGNHGVIVQNAGSVSSTGSAGVAITGSATTGNDIELNTSGDIGGGTTTGDITLTADTVVLAGAVNVQSSGALLITPRTASTAINLGTGATDAGLQLDDKELALLADGFSSITIGDATSGTGTVNLDNATFVDDVTIVGGSIAVTQLAANDTVDNGDGTGLRAVTLTARTGAITDGGDTGTDVTSGDLVVTSATGIGISTNAIDTTVARLEAVGGTGGVFVSNSADLSVGGISAIDGVSASNAEISITATGTLTITEAVNSGGGDVALTASEGVTLTGAAADVVTNGGTFTVDADSNDDASGSYSQDDAGSAVTTTGGTVSITAADIALIGSLSAGVGIVLVAPSTAASIGLGGAAGSFNLTDDEADRITASRLEIGTATSGAISIDDFSPANVTTLVLNTDEGVSEGTGDAGIDVSVTNLAIESDTGVDIDANVTTLAINNADAASNVQIDSTSASLTIGSVTTAAGALSGITTADGSITVAGATAIIVDNAVTANGGGISLTTSTGDLTVNADILAATAGTESVVLNAGDDVLLNVGTVQSIGTGDFRIDAGTSTGTGVFTMASGTLLDSNGGSLIIDADGDVTLAEIDHQSVGATDDVTIISTGGSITLLAGEGGLVATAGASVNLDRMPYWLEQSRVPAR